MGGPGTPPFWRTRDEFCTVFRYGIRLGDLKRIGFFVFQLTAFW